MSTTRPTLTRRSFEVPADAEIVRAVAGAAAAVTGIEPEIRGYGAWMDSAFLAAAEIETVIFGGRGDGAHALIEWADVASHLHAAEIYARAAQAYCAAR